MAFFERISNGWNLGMTSLETVKDNPALLFFPVFSSLSLIAICISFFGGFALLFGLGMDFDEWLNSSLGETAGMVALFIFYLINYFVIVFFNVGLVHCAKAVFEGKEVSWRDGLNYASTRFITILSWAALAATVGVILKILEDRLGSIISGIIGVVWSVATFFVVPVLAYENVDPFEAVKRSGVMMKENWGKAIGANFSFGVFVFLAYIAIIVACFGLGFALHPIFAVIVGVLAILLLHTVVSAAETVFIAATYQYLNDKPHGNFDGDVLDSIFIQKKK